MKSKVPLLTLNLIRDIESGKKRKVKFLGMDLMIDEKMFPLDSDYSISSKLTAKRIPDNAGVVLDVGCGTGALSIIAVKKGAKKVVSLDVDMRAVKNSEENVELHGLGDVVEVKKSDLFEALSSEEKFDVIIANLPLSNFDYDSDIKHCIFDMDYKIHDRFLRDAKKFLKEGGEILIPTGSFADEPELIRLVKKYDYKVLRIETENFGGHEWKLYFLGK